MRKYIAVILSVLIALSISAGCGGERVQSMPPELSASSLSVKMGETGQLGVNNYAGSVRWSSSDKSVAIVSQSGVVSPVSIGRCVVSAQLEENEKMSCMVEVLPGESSITAIKVTSLYSDTNDITINYENDSSVYLKARCTPDVSEKLVWSSSNEALAHVDGNGNVFVYGNGVVEITAAALNGIKGSCTVRIKNVPANVTAPVHTADETDSEADDEEIPVIASNEEKGKFENPVPVASPTAKTSVIVSDKNVYLKVGESFKLEYAVGNTQPDKLKWTSSDMAVVIVEQGRIVAIGDGRCTVSAVTEDGAVASCLVAVGKTEINKMKKEVAESKAEKQ